MRTHTTYQNDEVVVVNRDVGKNRNAIISAK